MLKMYQYRLFPTKKQSTIMNQWLERCRWLYNHFLEERKNSWKQEKKSLNYHTQAVSIVKLKQDKQPLSNIHSQVLQNVAIRVDLAFKAFFRRVKAIGEKAGYPRFKGKGRYDSFTFPQSGFALMKERLKISKIGSIRIKKHREIEGSIKTLTIRKINDKWYAYFSCEVEPKPLFITDKIIGIDVGLSSFATLSTGEKIENPRFFKEEEKVLAKAQRKFSKQEKETPKRKKVKKVVAHIHERIMNKRKDFAHKLSRILVNTFQVIAFEKLNVKDMMNNHTRVFGHKLNKSIGDVAWNQFTQFTTYKAEGAGRTVVFVDPRNTSKMCSRCGQFVEKKLSDRIHSCSCGLVMDRDQNASLNILRLGMQSLVSA